jgi:hypothetical protein
VCSMSSDALNSTSTTVVGITRLPFIISWSCLTGRYLIPGIQFVRMFQYKIFSLLGCSSTKYSVGKDVSSTRHSVRRDVPARNIQSGGMFQYETFSQYGCSSTKYLVSRNVPVRNTQSVRMFRHEIFIQ